MAEQQEFADFELEGLDLDNVKEFDGGSFQLLPPGEYTLDVIGVEQKPSSKNNPMIVVTFQVPEDAAEHGGSRVWGNYSLLKQSLGRLKTLMIACGASLDKFRASEIMGARIRATIVHNQGDARQNTETGEMMAPKTFANVSAERPIEVAAPAAPPPAKPPVAGPKPTTPPKNSTAGAARRA